jgi:hypothetical protein
VSKSPNNTRADKKVEWNLLTPSTAVPVGPVKCEVPWFVPV